MSDQDSLNRLARVLAKNYFDTSQTLFHTSTVRSDDTPALSELGETGDRVFTGPDAGILATQRPERTVLVVGAGVRSAFADGYPSAQAILAELKRLLTRLPAENKLELRRGVGVENEQSSGADDPVGHFEEALTVLAEEHGEARVRDELARLYRIRHRPHLSFEIIAHLFKHRFIDVIINFNFDELLDEAIDGEMGTSEYRRVYFEGQCTGLDTFLVDSRLKIPLYIKPHGTASYPSSIRFQPDAAASELSEPMRALIASIIGGHWIDDPVERAGTYAAYHVNLITVGFSMKSASLLNILRDVGAEHCNTGLTIFHINQGKGIASLRSMASSREWKHIEDVFIDVDDHEGLVKALRTLWIATKNYFADGFGPRGIARHEMIHRLFFSGAINEMEGRRVPHEDSHYFRARLTVEVAIALARGNGKIDLGTMAESRVGKIFDLLRTQQGGSEVSMHDVLKAFSYGEKVTFDGLDNSVFRVEYEHANNADALNRNMAHALWDCLARALERMGNRAFENHLKEIRQSRTHTEQMVEWFRQLASSDAHDISPTFRYRHLILMQQQRPADVIHTSLGLTLRFVEMMREKWDLMLAISETGKVIEHYARHVKNGNIADAPARRFCLVLAANDHPEIAAHRLTPFYDRLIGPGKPPLFYVPEWAHNQHMILLLKRKGDDLKPISAVRYETPRLGNRVNPVFIRSESPDDLKAALECFKRYLSMSVSEFRPGTTTAPNTDDRLRDLDTEGLWATLVKDSSPSGTPPSPKPGNQPFPPTRNRLRPG